MSEIQQRVDQKDPSAARAHKVMRNGPSIANVASNYLEVAAKSE